MPIDVLQDWKHNRGSRRIQLLLVQFRLVQKIRRRTRALAYPFAIVYRLYSLIFVGVELPVTTLVGRRLTILHGFGLVINSRTVIGDDVVLRHGCTLGERDLHGPCPVVGNNVSLGASSIVIGGVILGDFSRIGAGAIVTRDVEPGQSVKGPRAH